MAVNFDLTVIWAFIIAFAVFAYVVMDGFDLGIGILFPTFEVGPERDRAMNSIAPVWDGNETWLVLGGGGLFAAFPLAYAVILPATYPLIIAMLLVFRGVAFEYRWRDPGHRRLWDAAFTGGSLVAAMAQGMTLGALLQGIEVVDRAYAGSWFDWLTPYTLLTGLGTVAGYALLEQIEHHMTAPIVPEPRICRTLADGARDIPCCARADPDRHHRDRPAAFAVGRAPQQAVLAQPRALLLRHGRARLHHVALCRAARRHHLGCRGARAQPDLHAGRGGDHHAADHRLYRLGLLGLPRQGGRRGLSLMPGPDERPLWQRLGWMAVIWAASIAVLGTVAYIIRFWLKA